MSNNGFTVIKFFLHLSKEKQKKRFLKRIEQPEKNWKFSVADIKERERWNDYQKAFEEAISNTVSKTNPWYIYILKWGVCMSGKKGISFGKFLFTFVYVLIFPVLLLLLAGNWLWVEGLIFSLWFTALCVIAITYLYIKDPALLAERYKPPGSGGQKKWDIVIVILLVIGFTGWIVLMPLDAERFKWTAYFPIVLKIIGGLLLIPSAILFLRAYMDNPYLSGLVRIQEERKQRVITTGVYGIVRHPMYLGAFCLFVGAPMLMGSSYGLMLGALLTVLLAARSVGEEKMLTDELEGYADYRKKVKYRLIPFIW